MKKVIWVALSLLLVGLFVSALVGCGADTKAENERLKGENTSLKSGNDKLKQDVQKLTEDAKKMAAEKDATIASLTAENETLKKAGERPNGPDGEKEKEKVVTYRCAAFEQIRERCGER